jgi:hypothetical protein
MDTAGIVGMPWSDELSLNRSGIWTIRSGDCAIGAVLLAQRDRQLIVVRKATVKGYEFSSMHSLPGGLVRNGDPHSFPNSLKLSVLERAAKESGLDTEVIGSLSLDDPAYSPVTEYTVKGDLKRTLVLTVRAHLIGDFMPRSIDRSIDDARFMEISKETDWFAISPANRLIVARAFSTVLSAAEKLASKPAIDIALEKCNAAARTLDLPQLDHPWDQ